MTADLQPTLADSAMGHVQASSSSLDKLDECRKRALDEQTPTENEPASKRLRSLLQESAGEILRLQETPPPSLQESSSGTSEEDSSEDEQDECQGSILASYLLSDRRSSYRAESETAAAPVAPPIPWHGDGGSAYAPQNPTVECVDGKSYLQLGASSPPRERCPWYRRERFSVLHATLVKLGRHRGTTDPLLRTSVLLFNTMRHIERELEREGVSLAAAYNPHQGDSGPLMLDPPPPPPPAPPGEPASAGSPFPNSSPNPGFNVTPSPVHPTSTSLASSPSLNYSLSEDSGFEDGEEIDWSSVLSLTSGSLVEGEGGTGDWHLTPRPTPQLTSLSAEDVIRTFPEDGERTFPPADRSEEGEPGELTSLLAL